MNHNREEGDLPAVPEQEFSPETDTKTENVQETETGMTACAQSENTEETAADVPMEYPERDDMQDDDSREEDESKKTKKKKRHGFLKGFLLGIVVMLVISGVFMTFLFGQSSGILTSETKSKINSLADYIQTHYYQEVDDESLQEGLYKGLFKNLDVYSDYYTAEEYNELLDTTVSGTYGGIGATLQKDESTGMVSIVHVYEGSPAEEAGLQEGDILVYADDYDPTEMDLSEFVSHVRGEEGTSVHLTYYRNGDSDYQEVDVVRRNLVYPTVDYQMLDGNVGYIDVSEFTDTTPEAFQEALDDLKSQNMEYLIVDLRSNPGGMLTAVCDMLDDILPEGLLVYTEERDGKKTEYRSTDDESLDIPLAVLVNGNSASASEIFAGAIQDRKAGTIIGTTTYGKGVVQTIQKLTDGSALKLTTASYYTPGGTCIQGIGITPDVEIEYEFLGGEDDTYSIEFDNQIQKAIEVLTK